jgi:hypothetical protein
MTKNPQDRIKFLEHEHHELEKEIGKMEKHPHAEETRLHELKKRKLHIKDELEQLRNKQ